MNLSTVIDLDYILRLIKAELSVYKQSKLISNSVCVNYKKLASFENNPTDINFKLTNTTNWPVELNLSITHCDEKNTTTFQNMVKGIAYVHIPPTISIDGLPVSIENQLYNEIVIQCKINPNSTISIHHFDKHVVNHFFLTVYI